MVHIEPLILGDCKILLNNDLQLVSALIDRGYKIAYDNDFYYHGAVLIDEPYVLINNMENYIERFNNVDLPEVSYKFLKHRYITIA